MQTILVGDSEGQVTVYQLRGIENGSELQVNTFNWSRSLRQLHSCVTYLVNVFAIFFKRYESLNDVTFCSSEIFNFHWWNKHKR